MFVVDLDDTLLFKKSNDYSQMVPNKPEIKRLNKLKKEGNRVIIHTGRNWDKYEITLQQLQKYGILYDELVMGKPQGIYIDADSCKSLEDWENGK